LYSQSGVLHLVSLLLVIPGIVLMARAGALPTPGAGREGFSTEPL
jgi:hypothetical protein